MISILLIGHVKAWLYIEIEMLSYASSVGKNYQMVF